jgi:hypothetical protein
MKTLSRQYLSNLSIVSAHTTFIQPQVLNKKQPHFPCLQASSTAPSTSSASRLPGQSDALFEAGRRRSSSSRLITPHHQQQQQQQQQQGASASVQMASTPPVNTENSNQQAGASDEEEFESAGMIVDTDTMPVRSNTKPAVPGKNKRLIERNLMRSKRIL